MSNNEERQTTLVFDGDGTVHHGNDIFDVEQNKMVDDDSVPVGGGWTHRLRSCLYSTL